MGLVLDVVGQDIESVNFGGELRGDRSAAPVATCGYQAGRACGIARYDRPDAELADDAATLAERVDVTLHSLDVAEGSPARRDQVVADREHPFADDGQAGLAHHMMAIGDAPGTPALDL